MKIETAKQVYDDALQGDYSATVGVFLDKWVPFMFRKLKRQEMEIKTLKVWLEERPQPSEEMK